MRLRASLYVHAPFCRGKCRYCAFYSRPTGSDGPAPEALARYLAALRAEAEALGARFGRIHAPSLFFGGGTPSLLGAEALAEVLALLRERFDLAPDAEISLEANPDSATPELLRRLRGLGVNRLSLGVQSLDDAQLRALGRPHDAAQALVAFAAAREAGFDNLGLDLIFGLPGQSAADWLDTLRRAVALGPEHLSCYGLTVEPGTPLARDAAALATLPDDDAQAEMFLQGSALLRAAGYEHYEVSNFARPGRRCLHNLDGWRGGDVLGLGPAAASTVTQAGAPARWTNPADLEAWEALVLGGGAATHGRETLTPELRAREALMLALRTSDGLDLAVFAARFGHELRAERAELLAQLEREGLIRLAHGRLALTVAGFLLSNSVIRALGFEAWDENSA